MIHFWNSFYKFGAVKRVAKVAIIRNGNLLMGRRRDSGKWTEPGGHLEAGESPLQGAIREVKEETGVELDSSDITSLRSEFIKKPDGERLHAFTFRADISRKTPTTMKEDPDGEVHRWYWINLSGAKGKEILDNLHVPMDKNVILRGLAIQGLRVKPQYGATLLSKVREL